MLFNLALGWLVEELELVRISLDPSHFPERAISLVGDVSQVVSADGDDLPWVEVKALSRVHI